MVDISKDVCYIGDTGFDSGGSASLGIWFHRVFNIPLYFKGDNSHLETVNMYSNYDELYNMLEIKQPKLMIIFPNITGKPITQKTYDFMNALYKIREKFDSKIVMLDCTRKGFTYKNKTDNANKEFSDCFQFDAIWSISKADEERYKGSYKEYKYLDINIYQLGNKILENRDRTIGYVTRFVAMKGINRLLTEMTKSTYGNIPYIYLGNDHTPQSLDGKGMRGVPMTVVSFYTSFPENKHPKDCFSMKLSLDDSIVDDKVNIYPRYTIDNIEQVFSKVGLAICPTLARQHSKNISTSLNMPDWWNITNDDNTQIKRDDTYIKRNKDWWGIAMEYVNYEFIDYGIPVMFSRDYCETYDKTMIDSFPELIYNNIEDCLVYCQDNYDNLQQYAIKQREWLSGKLESINKNIEQEIVNLIER